MQILKDIKILVGLLIVWAPLYYVWNGSDTGEPLFSEWIVSIILAFSLIAAGSMTKPDGAAPRSKITYAISGIGCVTALAIVMEKYYESFADLDFQDFLSLATWTNNAAPIALMLLCVWTFNRVNNVRARLAKEVKEARCLGIFSAGTVEALRKRDEKDAQDLNLTTELWKETLKADKEYQDAINSGDKDVKDLLEVRRAALKIEKQLEAGGKCRDSGRPFCVWCGFPEFSMETVEGKSGAPIWKYRNQDGSPDMRVTDNFQQASWFGEFKCNECGATTLTTHYIERDPSAANRVWGYALKEGSKGSGKRTASDHDSSEEGESVNRNEAHRKGGG